MEPKSLSRSWDCFYRCVSTHWWLTVYHTLCKWTYVIQGYW